VTFSPDDGTVTDAIALPPFGGTSEGTCVAHLLEGAHMEPYKPPAIPIVYTFEIPR
jgi:hypothetical protein